MHLIKVAHEKQLDLVVNLAQTIWHEHFTPIIGAAQVAYMLKKFQSKQSIMQQLENGFSYYLITHNSQAIGYSAIIFNPAELFLSKLYILSSERNKGFGKQTIKYLEQLAFAQGMQKMSLTVNKNNLMAIKSYEKMGFVTMDSIIKDIGEGFVMDDYKLEKRLSISLE